MMHLLNKKQLLIYYTFLHILGYYIWIYYWKNDDFTKTLVGNTFSILAPFVSFFVLFFVYRQMKDRDRYFWLLLSLGCFSYVIGEACWIYYENILQTEVPFPGSPDFFYMLQFVFYIMAFIFKIWEKRGTLQLIKFIFDTCIIMTVAIAFSWHFVIKDIIAQEDITNLTLIVSIGYPIGDLILLFGAISFYFGSEYFFPRKMLFLIVGSLMVQVLADTAYLYLSVKDIYLSGGLFDPLWSLALLLMAISGKYALVNKVKNTPYEILKKKDTYAIKDFISFKLLLPYLNVIFLFIVMVVQDRQINSLIIGSACAILLVILRQIFTLLENQTLLAKYHILNEKLEQKISDRTAELSNKNQQLTSAIKKMKHMDYHDVLSDLPNRRLFLDQLTMAMEQANENKFKLAVVFIDLDRFKNINDTLGHGFGDLVLKHLSDLMLHNIRNIDTISRQGGDEFTILLNNISTKEDILPFINQIQSITAKPFIINGQEVHVSMSIGIALYPTDGNSAEELLKHADMAMYRVKADGGNNYGFFSTHMLEIVSRKITLENGLRKAILNEEFILNYQPQVNLITGEIVGMEALIRWNSSNAGIISPAEFIPLAEETKLIIPIGEWVLYTACKQAKVWYDDGYKSLKIAVNLSPVQFLEVNLVTTISTVLAKTGLPPTCLEIEITEGVAVYDAEEAIMKMQTLRNLGVRISIDDFGTGYSSFIYLKRFPINALKIARPFIQDITTNNSDKALVKSMISIAHSLGLSVIGEGVETTEQLQTLQELHCDEVQGYIYSKPLTTEQFTALLEKKHRDGSIVPLISTNKTSY